MFNLYLHISASTTAFLIGIIVFFFKIQGTKIEKHLYNILKLSLVITAVTGVFLNLVYFSAFHALAILTMVNVPISIKELAKGNQLKHNQNLFENYLGLFIAMIGTTFPLRFIGIRIYNDLLNIEYDNAVKYFYISMIIAVILSAILYIQGKKKILAYSKYTK